MCHWSWIYFLVFMNRSNVMCNIENATQHDILLQVNRHRHTDICKKQNKKTNLKPCKGTICQMSNEGGGSV